jgi:hypothetical protein
VVDDRTFVISLTEPSVFDAAHGSYQFVANDDDWAGKPVVREIEWP